MMYKSTRDGTVKEGRELPPLTEEDKQEIIELFEQYDKLVGLHKRNGIWKNNGGYSVSY